MKHVSSPAVPRRKFLLHRSLATAAIAGAPAFLRGQNLNSKLNIAFIGAGGHANSNLNALTLSAATAPASAKKNAERALAELGREPGAAPDENAVLFCDINQLTLDAAGARFPKARKVVDLRRVFDREGGFWSAVVVSTAEHTHVFAKSCMARAHPRQARLLRKAARL